MLSQLTPELVRRLDGLPPRATEYHFPAEAPVGYRLFSEGIRSEFVGRQSEFPQRQCRPEFIEELADRTVEMDVGLSIIRQIRAEDVSVLRAHCFARHAREFVALVESFELCFGYRFLFDTTPWIVYMDVADWLDLLAPQLAQPMPRVAFPETTDPATERMTNELVELNPGVARRALRSVATWARYVEFTIRNMDNRDTTSTEDHEFCMDRDRLAADLSQIDARGTEVESILNLAWALSARIGARNRVNHITRTWRDRAWREIMQTPGPIFSPWATRAVEIGADLAASTRLLIEAQPTGPDLAAHRALLDQMLTHIETKPEWAVVAITELVAFAQVAAERAFGELPHGGNA